ncbi:calmodulin-binding protein 60 B [Neltuma alba]|uniref:calmodulin-binding protein 60 B n=1 Tax=Neltuma alba TaxID=207710 RepID=UPI0010A2B492|nr:calmodulin-binding protein 60 B-like [Prosopis alba]
MASKRKANNCDIPAEKPKRRFEFEQTAEEQISLSDGGNTSVPCNCKCGCIVYQARLEAVIRQTVREEVAAAQHQSPRPELLTPNSNLSGEVSEARQNFQLEFSRKLRQEYYTQTKILAEDNAPPQIVLLNVGSRSIVTEGPMSSTEIEICVVPGDFGSGDHQNWSREEFNDNIIVRPREGREALLKGKDTRVTLKDGAAFIPKIEFTDISRWVRTGTFRLAARSKEADVKEAISQPFVVKDKRGASIMKHAIPSLKSEIWRLKKIGRGGELHKRLLQNGIETVKDFMRLHTINPSSLKEKFGNIPSGRWEAIMEHATACVIDDNVHYGYHTAERQLDFVFNSIYEVVRVSFDNGQTYRSPETFTSVEKRLVEVAKKEAYENEKDFVALPVNLEELGTVQTGESSNGMPPDGGAPQQVDLPATQQGQEYEWDLLYSPYSSLDHFLSNPLVLEAGSSSPLHCLLHSDAPPSTHDGRRSRWSKIRAAALWLMSPARTSLSRQRHPF